MQFVVVISSISIVLINFVECTTSNIQDYHLLSKESKGKNCTTTGLMCDTCQQLVTCMKYENGFHKISLETCADGQTCLHQRCTTERNPLCDADLKFSCNNVGVFPDPYDCQAYHFCVKGKNGKLLDYRTECDGNYGYDAASTYCKIELTDNDCLNNYTTGFPVDLCYYPGQTDSLRQNPSIYYICAQYSSTVKTLYPFLYVCPHGGIYEYHECFLIYRKNLEKLMKRF